MDKLHRGVELIGKRNDAVDKASQISLHRSLIKLRVLTAVRVREETRRRERDTRDKESGKSRETEPETRFVGRRVWAEANGLQSKPGGDL